MRERIASLFARHGLEAAVLVFGFSYAVITTPFGVSDEFAHFWRACGVSEGNLLAHTPPGGGYRGDSLPRSEEQIGDMLMLYRSVRIPSTHIDWQGWHRAWRIGFAPQDRVFLSFPATAAYSPVAYLPAALAIALSRECHLSVLAAFYLARLSNVIVVAALVGYAWRRLPYARESCALTMMLPMTLSQIGSLSIDSISFGVAFLWIALVLGLAPEEKSLDLRVAARASGAFCRRDWTRPDEIFLPASITRFPAVHRPGKSATRDIGSCRPGARPRSGVRCPLGDREQFAERSDEVGYRRQPGFADSVPARASRAIFGNLPAHIAGVPGHIRPPNRRGLGWLQIQLPSWLYLGMWIALIASTGFQSRGKVSARMRLFFLGLALIFLLSIYLAVYEKWNAVGAPFIEGVQGRYLILMLPLLAMAGMSRLCSYWRAERPVRIGLYTPCVRGQYLRAHDPVSRGIWIRNGSAFAEGTDEVRRG